MVPGKLGIFVLCAVEIGLAFEATFLYARHFIMESFTAEIWPFNAINLSASCLPNAGRCR